MWTAACCLSSFVLRRACGKMQTAVRGLLEAADLCLGPVRIGVLCTLYHVVQDSKVKGNGVTGIRTVVRHRRKKNW